jgi:acyl transferase domain-containing protein/acyl carrier protein
MSDDLDIAIVGMSCRFPGARNLDEFWHNLAAGVESISRFSERELLDSGVPASHLAHPGYVRAAPVLDAPGHFDAAHFGFSPLEARTMDPQHRLLLELAHEALEHAGCDPERYPGRIGVFTGSALNTYFTGVGLDRRLAEDYIPTLIGNDKDFLSTRISYKLNLKGPSITVQTACSTSMVAVHLARQSLLSNETDMTLAGAVSVRVPHRAGYFCDAGGVVSPDGRVRAFDAGANGTVFGSGGGILVLKRLADALADGDTIHALIKGSAVNNDGSGKAGYTAPSVDGQADAVVEALANAGIEADTISYVEAHGSGTPVGDPIEIAALTKAFRTSTPRAGYCAIGSVKTNVGHLDAAAAVAGIIKTVLALEHRKLPPSLHFSRANPEIDFPATPFYVNTRLQDWSSDGPRRAGVMSTGMGGTNAHLVLEEAPDAGETPPARPPHLLVLSARTETALDQATHRLREFLGRADAPNPVDAAYTLQVGRKALPHRRCVVCVDRDDAIAALGDAKRAFSGRSDEARRPLVLLLPGIGDHYVGMAHGLYETWPVFREEIDHCARILEPHLGIDIRNVVYPGSGSWKKQRRTAGIDLKKMLGQGGDASEDEDARNLNRTLFAQPALFTIEYALARLWQSLGIKPDAIVGHSMGEYVAACLAGVLSLEDALGLIATRAKLVNELPQGAMLAVTLPEPELRAMLPAELSISLINGPSLCVVAGPVAAIARFEETLNGKEIISRRVQNAHAFHSRMLDPIVQALEDEARKVRLNEPAIPYISNVTGTWITRAEATDPAYWARHANHTARFNDALRALWRFENPILLEAGPGRTLGVLALQHPDRRRAGDPVAIASIGHHYEIRPDGECLWEAIGRLWLSGVAIRWENAHPDARRRVPLPSYPFERQNYWLEPVRVLDAIPDTPDLIRKNPDPSQWLYLPSWKRMLPRTAGTEHMLLRLGEPRKWLVYADNCGLASVLIARLRSAGHEVVCVRAGGVFWQADARTFTIDPARYHDYESLFRALQANACLPDRIVHAWSVSHPVHDRPSGDAFTRAQVRGFYSLLYTARALAAHNVGNEIDLYALSNEVHDVCGTEVVCPDKATLLGPCIVIRQEYPNIRVRSIDLDISTGDGGHEAAAGLVLGELVDRDAGPFVAHRHGQRWVQSFEHVVLDPPDPTAAPFRKGGVYLITGGLGAVGIAISEYLAGRYGAKLVLVGRSSLPPRESWDAWRRGHRNEDAVCRKIRALERIEQLGADVSYASANVADADSMRRVIEQAYQRFGVLHGVIHGAGLVGDDGFLEIKNTSPEGCDGHFESKARGVRALEAALEGKPLDFCLLISSLASVLGGIGQAAYAGANAFMDAFARTHNRSHPVPWLSVNWDVWRVGDRAAAAVGPGATLKGLGMSADEAAAVMEIALTARAAGQLVVSTGDLAARIDQWVKLESLNAGRRAAAASPVQSTQDLRPGGLSAGDAPRDELERRVCRAWQDALGIDDIGINDDFSRLGGHSLIAIGIVAELRKAFQIDLPVRALFDAPTVAGLARGIRERMVAQIDALSEDDARQLLASGRPAEARPGMGMTG